MERFIWPPAIDDKSLQAFADEWVSHPGTPLLPLLQRIRIQTTDCVVEGRVQETRCASCANVRHVCDTSVQEAEKARAEGRGYIPGCTIETHAGYRPCPECSA